MLQPNNDVSPAMTLDERRAHIVDIGDALRGKGLQGKALAPAIHAALQLVGIHYANEEGSYNAYMHHRRRAGRERLRARVIGDDHLDTDLHGRRIADLEDRVSKLEEALVGVVALGALMRGHEEEGAGS